MKSKVFIGVVIALVVVCFFWMTLPKRPQQIVSSTMQSEALPPSHSLTRVVDNPPDEQLLNTHATLASFPVQAIVDGNRKYQDRLNAVRAITNNPPPADWQALQDFLLIKAPSDSEQSGLAFKNELLDRLCALTPPSAELGNTLIQMSRDGSLDIVVRDYALQHLVAYYEQAELANKSDPQIQQTIREVLWEGLSETDSSIAGTSLLALGRLSEGRGGFDSGLIGSAALQMADDNSAGELTRITAFQVCARFKMDQALPSVLQAARNGETVPLQISAVSALGALGGDAQISFLKSLLDGSEERLKLPAQRALAQISARLASRK